jgi:hypothetical protein
MHKTISAISKLEPNLVATFLIFGFIAVAVACGPVSASVANHIENVTTAQMQRRAVMTDTLARTQPAMVVTASVTLTSLSLAFSLAVLAWAYSRTRSAARTMSLPDHAVVVETPHGPRLVDARTGYNAALGADNAASLEQADALAHVLTAQATTKLAWYESAAVAMRVLRVVLDNRDAMPPVIVEALETSAGSALVRM